MPVGKNLPVAWEIHTIKKDQSNDNLGFLQEDIESKLQTEFPNVVVRQLDVLANPDNNEVVIKLFYAVEETNIEDEVTLNFS